MGSIASIVVVGNEFLFVQAALILGCCVEYVDRRA
jgi:hypothetical protein